MTVKITEKDDGKTKSRHLELNVLVIISENLRPETKTQNCKLKKIM